jgi:alpha/beta superfamily hydrolase
MNRTFFAFLPLLLLAGCANEIDGPPKPATAGASGQPSSSAATLTEARHGFVTRPGPQPQPARDPIPAPPPALFQLIRYESAVGPLAAYLTPDPGDGQKHPAIVWITGGDCNSIGEVWEPATPSDDQTAAAYRETGLIMMFPSLRGGNDNPGRREGFFGEVDDVIAAADSLAKQPYVDPKRIYLGGHSTGGTLTMLVAESTDRFRTVFSFGPADDVLGYGGQFVYHDTSNAQENALRSPALWLNSVKSPLFILEGITGNIGSLRAMASASKNPKIRFLPVQGATHFSILAPVNKLIATKILADDGPTPAISLSEAEVNAAMVK